jgi:hypothetical protein
MTGAFKPWRSAPIEAQIQQTCTQILELDGWRALRTDPVSRREWGKGFGEPGMADHLYIRYVDLPGKKGGDPNLRSLAQLMWIEFKRIRTGRKASTKATVSQQTWHQAERARGALTLIAGVDFPATIEGFEAWYKASGLNRRIK